VIRTRLTTPMQRSLLRLLDAGMQDAMEAWVAMGADTLTCSCLRAEVRGEGGDPGPDGYFSIARMEGALRGEIGFFLPLPLAATIAGAMVMLPADQVRAWHEARTLPAQGHDAALEACNILCGAFASGVGRRLSLDLSVSRKSTALLRPFESASQAAARFPWIPAVRVVARVSPMSGPPWEVEISLPLDALRSAGAALGIEHPLREVKGLLLHLSPDRAAQEETARLLEGEPIAVEPVRGVDEALDAAARSGASAVLLDLLADPRETLEQVRRLRADPRTAGLRLLILADAIGREVVIAAIQAGARDWLVRPITPESAARIAGHVLR